MTQKNDFMKWKKARILRAIGMILTLSLGYLIPYITDNTQILRLKTIGWAILLFLAFQLIFPISDKIEGSINSGEEDDTKV